MSDTEQPATAQGAVLDEQPDAYNEAARVMADKARTQTATDRPARIECAALYTEAGVVFSLPRPARHFDVIQHMVAQGVSEEEIAGATQGFTTDTLPFVRRRPAKRIAYKAGQLLRETHPTELFSEDVW